MSEFQYFVFIFSLVMILSWDIIYLSFNSVFHGDEFDVLLGAKKAADYLALNDWYNAASRIVIIKSSHFFLIYNALVIYFFGNFEFLLRLPDLLGWVLMVCFGALTTANLGGRNLGILATLFLCFTQLDLIIARPVCIGAHGAFISGLLYLLSRNKFNLIYDQKHPRRYQIGGWLIFLSFTVIPSIGLITLTYHSLSLIEALRNKLSLQSFWIYTKKTSPFIFLYSIYLVAFIGVPAYYHYVKGFPLVGILKHLGYRSKYAGGLFGEYGLPEQILYFNNFILPIVGILIYLFSVYFIVRNHWKVTTILSLYFICQHFIIGHNYNYVLLIWIWIFPWFLWGISKASFRFLPISKKVFLGVLMTAFIIYSPPWKVHRHDSWLRAQPSKLDDIRQMIKIGLKNTQDGYLLGTSGFDGGYYFYDERRINNYSSKGAILDVFEENEAGCLKIKDDYTGLHPRLVFSNHSLNFCKHILAKANQLSNVYVHVINREVQPKKMNFQSIEN